MPRYTLLVICVCLWCVPLLATPVELPNPSFESGEESPESWTPLPLSLSDPSYLWDSETAFSGSRSLSTRSTRYRYGRWLASPQPVENSGYTWYTFSGQVKTQQNNGEVYLCIAWLDEKGHLITTSDALMLPPGDNDWQTVTVDALPAVGAVSVSFWCISNHNAGQTWFDDLSVTLTNLPGGGDYDQFTRDYPSNPLAVSAHLMRVQSLMTQAKWIREKGFYDPNAQAQASALYAQAAGVSRLDSVLEQAAPERVEAVKAQFEALVDSALWEASITAHSAREVDKAKGYLQQIVNRDQTADFKTRAEGALNALADRQQ